LRLTERAWRDCALPLGFNGPTSQYSKELNMSAINGDKARFHRERKKQIHRRLRKQEMLKAFAKLSNPAAPAREKQV
jgi:hypothetical protein